MRHATRSVQTRFAGAGVFLRVPGLGEAAGRGRATRMGGRLGAAGTLGAAEANELARLAQGAATHGAAPGSFSVRGLGNRRLVDVARLLPRERRGDTYTHTSRRRDELLLLPRSRSWGTPGAATRRLAACCPCRLYTDWNHGSRRHPTVHLSDALWLSVTAAHADPLDAAASHYTPRPACVAAHSPSVAPHCCACTCVHFRTTAVHD